MKFSFSQPFRNEHDDDDNCNSGSKESKSGCLRECISMENNVECSEQQQQVI